MYPPRALQPFDLQSAGRRFLKTFGFSLVQGAIVGGLLGLLASTRVPRAENDVDPERRSLYQQLADSLESVELRFYDWRARALGGASKPSDAVVLVTVDDETLAQARQDRAPGIAMQPWPREVVGGLVQRMVKEGAALTLVDLVFPDVSPRACFIPEVHGLRDDEGDDQNFRHLLEKNPGSAALAFSWTLNMEVPPSSLLGPSTVVLAGQYESEAQARPFIRAILENGLRAYLVPEGKGFQLWSEIADNDVPVTVAALGLRGTPSVREFSPSLRSYQVTPTDLLVSLAEVNVGGIDPSALTQTTSLQHPISALLSDEVLYGTVTASPDPDGIVRGIPHLVSYRDRAGRQHILPSLPLRAAMKMAGTDELSWKQGRLFIGERFSIPMDRSGYTLVRWDAAEAGRRAQGSLKRVINAWKLFANIQAELNEEPPRYRNELDGRVVIFTNTSTYATDFKPTPIGHVVAGGAILGQSLVNLLQSEGITRAPPRTDLFITLGLAFLGAFLAMTSSRAVRSMWGVTCFFLFGAAVAGAYLLIARYVFVHQHLWIATAAPLMAMGTAFVFTFAYTFRNERKVRDLINTALGRYVSPEVASRVTRDLSLMRPERRQMSILFSDIEGFTRMSEQLSPEKLVTLLNEYLTDMTAIVRNNGGQVDKYIGDAVMAFWGAPVRTEQHAQLACKTALEMRAALLQRQAEWEKRFGHKITFRAGVNSGEVVVGDMGSELKSNYTVMGDAVNLASRLEGANKAYGTFLLVGESTAAISSDGFVFREVDRVRVKGREQPARVFELLAEKGTSSPETVSTLILYEQALATYHRRAFAEALRLFEKCFSEFGDPVSAVYIGRCRDFLAEPPPEDWDGVASLKDK